MTSLRIAARPRSGFVPAIPVARTLALLRALALGTLGCITTVGIWWLVSTTLQPVQLPAPNVVLQTLLDDLHSIPALNYVAFQSGGILDAVRYTLGDVMLGLGIGVPIGFGLGLVLGTARGARELLGPPLLALGTMPTLVVLPFLLIWFGTSRLAQSGMVILFSTLTVAGVTQQSARHTALHFAQYAASLGATRRRVVLRVIAPATIPEAVGGVRLSAALGWSLATVAELIGAQHGAGSEIQALAQLSRTSDILATVLALGLVAVALDALILLVSKVALRWTE